MCGDPLSALTLLLSTWNNMHCSDEIRPGIWNIFCCLYEHSVHMHGRHRSLFTGRSHIGHCASSSEWFAGVAKIDQGGTQNKETLTKSLLLVITSWFFLLLFYWIIWKRNENNANKWKTDGKSRSFCWSGRSLIQILWIVFRMLLVSLCVLHLSSIQFVFPFISIHFNSFHLIQLGIFSSKNVIILTPFFGFWPWFRCFGSIRGPLYAHLSAAGIFCLFHFSNMKFTRYFNVSTFGS